MSADDYKLFFEESCDLFGILEVNNLKFQTINRKAWGSCLNWYHDEEILGKSFTDFLHPKDICVMNNVDRRKNGKRTIEEMSSTSDDSSYDKKIGKEFIVSALREIMVSKSRDSRIVKQFRGKDGTYRWISWNATFVGEHMKKTPNDYSHASKEKILVCGRDITEQRERKKSIMESERRLRESQDMALIGQWDHDFNTDTLLWSPVIYDVFGVDPEKFGATNEAFLNAIHPDDRDMVDKARQKHVSTKKSYEIDHRLLSPNGTLKWVKERCRSEYNKDGSPARSIGTVQDISDLRLAKEHAEESDRLKSSFLANMSHEIRTPMNAVIGFTDLMLMDGKQLSIDYQEYLEIIRNSGKLLLTLVNDILDLSKIEAGELKLENKDFFLGEVLRTIEFNARALITRKGDTIDFKTPSLTYSQTSGNNHRDLMIIDGIEGRVVGDPTRLQQVLNNLLSNAIKFTKSGSIEYGVNILTGGSADMLEFYVTDTGVGIPEQKQKEVFEPFRQAHGSEGSKTLGGTGLGLSIALKLVENMGGEMSLKSSINPMDHGSSFKFTIPYIVACPMNKKARVGEIDYVVGQAGRVVKEVKLERLSGRVLVVDDNRINLKLCQRFLTRIGCVTETAENGKVAIAKFQQYGDSLDVILMDKEMPVMDGFETVAKIRAIEAAESRIPTPIVAVTAAAMAGDREECLAVGCDDYLTKPLSHVALNSVLSKYLSKMK
mmetsp:Transcript_44555/g.52171  ORF Transcript_44555/g.52171 Transcript_44555/m.52171 type:complete len:718 (+) Transcript_44555:125-2278(+)